MVREAKCKCCQSWWYITDIKDGLCINCNAYMTRIKRSLSQNKTYIDELKSKLKTKDTEIRNQVCDEIEKAAKQDITIVEDYFKIVDIVNKARRGEL